MFFHEDEIFDHLDLMLESAELIGERFSRIRVPEDFVLSAEGVTILLQKIRSDFPAAER